MKAVLISIQPKWCELIASGKKTVEVRKTKPKIETPFKCYIYATKPRHYFKISKHFLTSDESLFLVNGKVKMCEGFGVEYEDPDYKHLNCKVIGEFVCDKFYDIIQYGFGAKVFTDNLETEVEPSEFIKMSCLSEEQIFDYIGNKDGYGWHISDLVIYDKPKELSEFYQKGKSGDKFYYDYCSGCPHHETPVSEYPCNECDGNRNYLYRPPQSYMYVEELR